MSLQRAHSQGRRLAAAWLVAGLLVLLAQMVGTVHELDPQNSAADHTCEVCVAAASLDHAVVGEIHTLAPLPVAADLPACSVFVTAEASRLQPPSRGPPAAA